MLKIVYISVLLSLFFVNGYSEGRESRHAESSGSAGDSILCLADFFAGEEILEISLEFDIKNFQRTKASEKYKSAILSIESAGSPVVSYNVKLKTRGIFRKSYCSMPPFWLNVKNSELDTEDFFSAPKMKIVTKCMKADFYEDYVMKEYLAYKMYNLISPYSFRVRLLNIKYIDTGRDGKITEALAFAIEPLALLADRLNATIVENEALSIRNVNAVVMDRLAMFYYMIGNTDFSIPGAHNVKLISLNEPGHAGVIPVPYDFDFTGFVNTIYAKPAENARISEVTTRYFSGLCRSDQIYEQIIREFNLLSKDIHCLLQMAEHINIQQKLEMLRFIEAFYTEIASPDFIEWKIRPSCL